MQTIANTNLTLSDLVKAYAGMGSGAMPAAAVQGAVLASASQMFMASKAIEYADMVEKIVPAEQAELLTLTRVSAGAGGDLSATFTAASSRRWQTRVFGIMMDFVASNQVVIPGFSVSVSGLTAQGETNTNVLKIQSANTQPMGGNKLCRAWAFPTTLYGGVPLFTSWAFQPEFVATLLPSMPITVTVSDTLPSGVTASYYLLTRGEQGVDAMTGAMLAGRINVGQAVAHAMSGRGA